MIAIQDAPGEEPPFAYHALLRNVELVSGTAGSAGTPALPAGLVIAPGRYAFAGMAYDLKMQGLYRFCHPFKENQQRIVFDAHKRDVEALLSGLAWIASHGNSDDAASNVDLTEKAATRKLFLTCGNSSRWALHVLARCKVRARPVSTLTLEPWNSYDNGHSMIEVYREDLKRWVLYDLDSNACFVHGKELLSLVEMVERSAAGAYEIKFLAGDAPLDVSNFKSKTNAYDWAFSSERTAQAE